MLNEWKNWCRLCGQVKSAECNDFIKEEYFFNILEAVQKFLSITIKTTDEIPQRICSICHEFIKSIIHFSEISIKVQDMFTEIQSEPLIDFDLDLLRKKYNLIEDEKSSISNNTIVFVACGQTRDNFHNDKLSLLEDVKPKVRKKIRNSQETINQDISFNEKTEIDNCIQIVNEKITTEQEVYLQNIEINQQNEKLLKFESDIIQENSGLFNCDICKKKLTTVDGYRLHMKFKHSIAIGKDLYRCNECSKEFKKMRNLTEHKKLHLPAEDRKWYPCPHCDKKFTAFWYVSVHIRTVHDKERSYICEQCGKAFSQHSLLVTHKLVHTNLKPFKCTQCPNSFKCAQSLKQHIDIHQDTKYICPLCGVKLNTKQILRLHMVIHSDEKKFKCNFCEKVFKRSKDLKNHLIIHSGLKPYECTFCEQTFTNGSNCRKHKKLFHPLELDELEKSGGKKHCEKVPKLEQLQAITSCKQNS